MLSCGVNYFNDIPCYFDVAVCCRSVTVSLAAGIGQAALDSFQDCIEVLEESVLRQENMNSPDQTAATFNASVVSVQDEL